MTNRVPLYFGGVNIGSCLEVSDSSFRWNVNILKKMSCRPHNAYPVIKQISTDCIGRHDESSGFCK